MYVENAKKLLKASMEGLNPYAGFTPSVPSGERLTPGTNAFNAAGSDHYHLDVDYGDDSTEATGVKELPHTAFVLVAGGLGERLGYSVRNSTECITVHSWVKVAFAGNQGISPRRFSFGQAVPPVLH